jgi:hypothetical protein
MQIIGNPASCWELIAHASRMIVALGYHTAIESEPKTDLDEEIRAVVAWCAQFDSCMSLLLLRPRSLPPLNVRLSSLLKPDPANPMSVFEIIAMEMIPVHYKILELTLEGNAKRTIPSLKAEVAELRASMSAIFALMIKVGQTRNFEDCRTRSDTRYRRDPRIFLTLTPIFYSTGSVSSSNTFQR